MKKSLFTSVAVAALVFGIGTSTAFAKEAGDLRGNPYGHPMNGVSEKDFEPRLSGPMAGHGGMGIGGADVFGTVSSISEDKKILTVKDIDGKETEVHVNPFTRINSHNEEIEPKDNKKERRHPMEEVKFSDVQKGDYVAVKKMNTETKTLEAAHIIVAKEDK
ncbi:hypothetical protein [Treponema sp.]|uniref:hypothetical protein n=1 Tax=Treponema sp. TaxID=166 RepID=UPI003890BA7A